MGQNKKSFLINIVIMLIIFLSMISWIFKLSGIFFVFELLLIVLFLIVAVILMYGIGTCKRWAWKGMLIFFSLNLINQLLVYFRTFVFTDMVLPIMTSGLGFLIALIMVESEDDEWIDEPNVIDYKEDKNDKKNSNKKDGNSNDLTDVKEIKSEKKSDAKKTNRNESVKKKPVKKKSTNKKVIKKDVLKKTPKKK